MNTNAARAVSVRSIELVDHPEIVFDGKRRGFLGSLVQLAAPIGLLCANAVFALVIWSIFEEAFFSWGWRIPFLLSIILVGVAAAKLRLATSLDESGAGRRAEGLSDALASLWRCSLERKLQQHIATKNSLENSAD